MMLEGQWSVARQDLYDFCQRSYYLHYISDFPKPEAVSSEFAFFNLRVFALKSLFYDRQLNPFNFAHELYAESFKLGVSAEKLDTLHDELQQFVESNFYRETSSLMVHLLPAKEFASVYVDTVKVLGSIHFAWLDKNGQTNIVNLSKQHLPFMTLYGLKVLGCNFNKLNVGVLHTSHQVTWVEADWQAIQVLQDKALSFNYSDDPVDYPLNSDPRHCPSCKYRTSCEELCAKL